MSVIIGLHNPKNAANLANIKRTLSCYGGGQIQITGNRIENMDRMPRPLRDRRYNNATITPVIRFGCPIGYIPIAVEVDGSMPIKEFEHPKQAMYFFGPEDGSLPSTILRFCHYVVKIPTSECLNLAVAAATVLYDRVYKRGTL